MSKIIREDGNYAIRSLFHPLTHSILTTRFLFYIKSAVKGINGKELDMPVNDGEVRINGAKILAKDRQVSNGVVHSIDVVNLPAV